MLFFGTVNTMKNEICRSWVGVTKIKINTLMPRTDPCDFCIFAAWTPLIFMVNW